MYTVRVHPLREGGRAGALSHVAAYQHPLPAGDWVLCIVSSEPSNDIARCVMFPFTDEGVWVESGEIIRSR